MMAVFGPISRRRILVLPQAFATLLGNMPSSNKRQKSVTEEEKRYRRQFHWRRMVLRIFTIMANSVYQMVENHLGLQPNKKKAQNRMVETIRGMSPEELQEAHEMIKSAMIAAQYQEEDWSVVEPAPTLSPLKRQAEESDTETGMSTDEFANPKVLLCYCNLEAILLRTKKRGPNLHRLFWRCPRFADVGNRCEFFQWEAIRGPDLHHRRRGDLPHRALREAASPGSMPRTPNEVNDSLLVDEPCGCKNPRLVGTGSNAWVTQIRCTQCGKMVTRRSTSKAREYYAKKNTVPPTPKELPPTPPTSSTSTPKPSVMPGTPLSNNLFGARADKPASASSHVSASSSNRETKSKKSSSAGTLEDAIPVLDETYAEYQEFKRFMEAKKAAESAQSRRK